MKNVEINSALASKVKAVVSKGLCSGLGEPVPGFMCVEAAVCFAMGLPHGDTPPCVGESVRHAKIALNDARWSSDEARAKGMLPLAIAQLGSDSIDQQVFSEKLVLVFIAKMLPKTLRAAGRIKEAEQCEGVITLAEAKTAANAAARTAANAAHVARAAARTADAAADAAHFAHVARAAARTADAAANVVDAAAYAAAGAAANAARAAADAAAYVADAAADAARAAADDTERDEVLTEFANLMLDVLGELKSPGCEFLYLLDEN